MSDLRAVLNTSVPMDAIADFCQRWNIIELALFGSALTDEFGPDSDIDVLVTFAQGGTRSLSEVIQMNEEIEALLKREVDMVERQSIERSPNYLRRSAILKSAKTIYAS